MSKKELEGAPFVVKTFQLLNESPHRDLVSWSETKDSFIVWNPVDFAAEILPKYFKHNNFCSFIRQLNTYGFHKVESKQWEFKHEFFQEGRTDMLKNISRRRSKKRDERDFDEPPTVPNKKVMAREEQEDKEEVDKLKDLNTLLMKEVVRLQQQQETTNDTIKQILAELISSRQEQREITKKVTEIADFKEPFPPSKLQTPLSSPATFSSPLSVPSSPASIHSPYSQSTPIPHSPQQIRHPNSGYTYVKAENDQQQPLLSSYPTYNEILAQNNIPPYPQYQLPQNPAFSHYLQPPQTIPKLPQQPQMNFMEPRNDILDSFINNDDNFFTLDELSSNTLTGEFQTIQSLPNEMVNGVNLGLNDPYAIAFQ